MITINRLSMPSEWTPKVGDLLEITNITEVGKGRWIYDVKFSLVKIVRIAFCSASERRRVAWKIQKI